MADSTYFALLQLVLVPLSVTTDVHTIVSGEGFLSSFILSPKNAAIVAMLAAIANFFSQVIFSL